MTKMYQVWFDNDYYKTVKARVRKGIKFLNKNVPGWRKSINLRELDLGAGDRCVLGQTFKKTILAENENNDNYYSSGYDFGVRKYFHDDDAKAAQYGFHILDDEIHQYEELAKEYRKNAVDPWTLLGEVWEDEIRRIPR